jgi:hypothetical protein
MRLRLAFNLRKSKELLLKKMAPRISPKTTTPMETLHKTHEIPKRIIKSPI